MANISLPSCLLEIPDSPHQPGPEFKFPKHSFGKETVVWQSFQPAWLCGVFSTTTKLTTYPTAPHTCKRLQIAVDELLKLIDAAFVSGSL